MEGLKMMVHGVSDYALACLPVVFHGGKVDIGSYQCWLDPIGVVFSIR